MANLTEKAMLYRLNISQWTARRHDKSVSQEVASNHGTSVDSGRYNKVLIAREALSKIATAQSSARNFHYQNTLPWMDDGARILPAANYFPYCEAMAKFRAEFDAEVAAFLDSYADYVEAARVRLNGLFDAADYPPAREIARRFAFDVIPMPLPDATDFRVDLGAGEESRIRAEIQDRTNAAIAGAVKDTWSRVHDVVSKMAERLRAYSGAKDGAFRDSLVSNVRDLVDLLPRLNVTGDAELAETARRMAEQLCQYDAQALREDSALRDKVARDAESIMASMEGYFGEAAQPLAA